VPSPSSGNQHQLRYCNIFNSDSAATTVTIRTNYNGTTRNAIVTTLQTNEYLQYTHRTGWKVFDINGSLKTANGDVFWQHPTFTDFFITSNYTSTYTLSTTACVYMGKATNSYKQVMVNVFLGTPGSGVTWAECAIYKGTPSLGSIPTLTRCGFVDTSGLFITTAGGKGVLIPVTNINAGDDLWFAAGNVATTQNIVLRAHSIVDDIGAGFFGTLSVGSRPSLSGSISPTLSTTANPIRFTWHGD
jgi:hypothetical protein